MPEKDAYFYSLTDHSLSLAPDECFNPTIGELLPHFLATAEFSGWQSCDAQLLALIRAKLKRRVHARALRTNCTVIGDPRTAPDALFALDGRLSKHQLRRACLDLAKLGPPDVVLVQATRAVRFEARSWKGRLAQFCLMLEEVFHEAPPGAIVVADEPHAVYRLKDELWRRNQKRDSALRWHSPHEYRISGIPSTAGGEGLLLAGAREHPHPAPRQFDVHIVDADTAKVAKKLSHITKSAPAEKKAGSALVDAASLLSRLAAMPCGIRHLSEHLAGADVSHHTRASFDWLAHMGAVREFERNVGVGDRRADVEDCLERGSRLYENYQEATPFAHKLAGLVATAARSNKRTVAIVFTSALYRRLAERFLADYDQYPDGVCYHSFRERVHLLAATRLEDYIDGLQQGAKLVFAGLNEEGLRLLFTDDRVLAHSVVLLTLRAAQYLRATLKPIVERMPQFKSYKPRMESILRQLTDLPDDASVLAVGDYVLPTFRVELSSDFSMGSQEIDADAWAIRFDTGITQYRRDTSEVYVYDPASPRASDAGFRTCQVRSLEIGDKVFVMSAEMREMVDQVLRDAGVPIHSDTTFEPALRSYHEQVQLRLSTQFKQPTPASQVRALREAMVALDPHLEPVLPSLQAMRHWIDLGRSPDTPFEQLRPQAPQREASFRLFAQALGFSALEAAYQWHRVIMAVRNSRQLDGRHVADIYAYMLLQPESAMANSNIKRQTLSHLFDSARESVATVEYIGCLRESKQ